MRLYQASALTLLFIGIIVSPSSGTLSSLSFAYIVNANPHCFELERHVAACAFPFAFAKAGSNSAARIAIIAITTSSSISVKPDRQAQACDFIIQCGRLIARLLRIFELTGFLPNLIRFSTTKSRLRTYRARDRILP